jgi:hypothetical protein
MTRIPKPTALDRAALVCLAGVLALLLALFAYNSSAESTPSPRQRYLQALEHTKDLPRGHLWAVCRAETRCRMVVSLGRGRGGTGCDVGPWAIHVRDCNSYAGQLHVEHLMDWETNAAAAAARLKRSRDKCKRLGNPGRCTWCPDVFYNVNSKTWCGKVMGISGGNT